MTTDSANKPNAYHGGYESQQRGHHQPVSDRDNRTTASDLVGYPHASVFPRGGGGRNITWAAQLLRISQPTLSRQIKQLEQDLGVTLLARGNQSVSLTTEGELLREHAQTIVSLSDKTVFELQHAGSELDGIISVGCGEVLGMAWLARAMRRFHDLHPRVEFSVFSSSADNIQTRIEQGLLDLGLLLEPADTARYEYTPTGVRERWTALVSEHHPLAMHATVSPADLHGGVSFYRPADGREAPRRAGSVGISTNRGSSAPAICPSTRRPWSPPVWAYACASTPEPTTMASDPSH